jgi:CubicO group peptidase (beta-lactamase class C family)
MTATPVPVQTVADVDGIVTSALDQVCAAGSEAAIQVCVEAGGRRLVDVAAGWQDLDTLMPADVDSLFNVFSATKGVVAAAAVDLLGSGLLRPEMPVAACWPEFAVHGKDRVTITHLLTHTAGIPQMPAGVSVETMCDWERMVALVAELEPLWRPGSAMGYHAYTYGWAVGEVLRRVLATPATVGDLVRETVGFAVGGCDFWIGVPAQAEPRIVTLYKPGSEPRRRPELSAAAIPATLDTGPEVYNRPDVRRACLPAAGGISSARSLAAIYAMLAARTANADLDPGASWFARATSVWRDETDLVTGLPTARGLGFIVSAPSERLAPFSAERPGFGHPGAGGSLAWADVRTGAGIAITRSRMTAAGWRGAEMQRLVAAALKALDTAVGSVPVTTAGRGIDGP